MVVSEEVGYWFIFSLEHRGYLLICSLITFKSNFYSLFKRTSANQKQPYYYVRIVNEKYCIIIVVISLFLFVSVQTKFLLENEIWKSFNKISVQITLRGVQVDPRICHSAS